MTERTTKKDNIEDLLLAGKAPAEIAEILGVNRRYAVAVAWRMRNPEREKAIKRAIAQRLRADPEWLDKERERRRMKHKSCAQTASIAATGRKHAGVGGCANFNKRRRVSRTMGKRLLFLSVMPSST